MDCEQACSNVRGAVSFGLPVFASALVGMRAALGPASAGILASASMGSYGHLPLALITVLVLLS